jgi:hypothetical protein
MFFELLRFELKENRTKVARPKGPDHGIQSAAFVEKKNARYWIPPINLTALSCIQ